VDNRFADGEGHVWCSPSWDTKSNTCPSRLLNRFRRSEALWGLTETDCCASSCLPDTAVMKLRRNPGTAIALVLASHPLESLSIAAGGGVAAPVSGGSVAGGGGVRG